MCKNHVHCYLLQKDSIEVHYHIANKVHNSSDRKPLDNRCYQHQIFYRRMKTLHFTVWLEGRI